MKKRSLNSPGRGGRRFAALLLALLMAGSVFAGAAPTALAEETEEQALPVEEAGEQTPAVSEADDADEPLLTPSGYRVFRVDIYTYEGSSGSVSVENVLPAVPGYDPGAHITVNTTPGSEEGIPSATTDVRVELPEETVTFDLVITPGPGCTLGQISPSVSSGSYYNFAPVPDMEDLRLENCPGLVRDGENWRLFVNVVANGGGVHLFFDRYREIPIGDTVDLSGIFQYPEDLVSWEPEIVSVNGNGRVSACSYGRAIVSGGAAETCCIQTRFRDVMDPTQFYYDPIYWGADMGLTTGYSDGTFRPTTGCNRAAVMAFLYRLAGEPPVAAPTGGSPFNDISEADGDLYRAVLWGVQNGITTGFDDGGFHPWATCNRAAIVTFLWRFANKPGSSGATTFSDMTGNDDFDRAISWAAERGITTGYDGNVFKPWATCNRLAVMTFLNRFFVHTYG